MMEFGSTSKDFASFSKFLFGRIGRFQQVTTEKIWKTRFFEDRLGFLLNTGAWVQSDFGAQ
jgi:hypothetical protein